MRRWPDVTRDMLPPDGQAAWDHIAATRGGVGGPYQVLIEVPALAERVADLGTYLRFEGLLDAPERELAILVVARELGARFEWVGHEPIARRAGTRPEAIEVVRTQASTDGLAERERLIVDLVRALHREHRIPEPLFAAGRDAFGQARLVELVGLAGYYAMIALVLVGFEVEPTGGGPAPF
ncbi:MAG TPA: carboxymuconolactone decarboxylase family protein [Chloroflexota bacterium]|jgi:4-carboxymuconolactone decarboxylase|nr:carboxymuconolactone decarboxylase family protein [Chloroflexota bacterium]